MITHTIMPMSPKQAGQVTGVSRRTIMRAIETHNLRAFRDNKNQWRITNDDLESWARAHRAHCSPTEQKEATAQPSPDDDHHNAHPNISPQDTLELVRVKAELEGERIRREAVESDRDHWREIAQKLAESRPRKWWFW
ncbi:helix-turn-helix domain-containing protein [Acetobacter orientalis]|uniref:helix-turn-helix domain-containing protein n=1 Tax=Acetobacter orientalis TaxID=146474 RepID=UPI0015C5039F|nr:helix-turn-helix domain-containing protein [Acetobacter orientalis]